MSWPLPYNMGDWEASVARNRAALAEICDDCTFDACDIDLRFRAEDEARERLDRAEIELRYARARSQFVMTNWDGTEDACWLLGVASVATVRFPDGQVQTMDRESFFRDARRGTESS